MQVISHETRTSIKITPAATASDRRIKNFTYVDAVRKLPCNFTPEEVAPIIRRIRPELVGQVRALFVVLCDDQFWQQLRKFEAKSKDAAAQGSGASVPVVPQPSGSAPVPPGLAPATGHKGSRNSKRGASSALGNNSKK